MKPKAQVEYRAIADLKELPGNPRLFYLNRLVEE